MYNIETLIETFSQLTDWEDRYTLLIDLGKKLPTLIDEFKTEAFKVRGCMSQVWLVPYKEKDKPDLFFFKGDSDAAIVKGLLAIVLMVYNGQTSKQIQAINIEQIFSQLGLSSHLSPTRRNGFFSMVQKIKAYAT